VLGAMIFTFRSVFGFYKNVWRYTYTRAYLGAIVQDASATLVTIALASIVRAIINRNFVVNIWQFIVIATMFCLITLSSRYAYRLIYKYRNTITDEPSAHKINVAIVGAGQMGALLADELRCSKTSSYNPIAFIDKDKAKKGEFIGGVKVYHEDDPSFAVMYGTKQAPTLLYIVGDDVTTFPDITGVKEFIKVMATA
jgi:FlaA1/EpsC-like NDP-sugar epimerase